MTGSDICMIVMHPRTAFAIAHDSEVAQYSLSVYWIQVGEMLPAIDARQSLGR